MFNSYKDKPDLKNTLNVGYGQMATVQLPKFEARICTFHGF